MLYTLSMASIQRYTVRGKSYWRIVESRRVNGKPRAIPVLHLGTADGLLKKLQSGAPVVVKTYAHGEVAALKQIADDLQLVEIIDRHAGRSRRGTSVGLSLLLIAMNRLIEPCSKRAMSDWIEHTSLSRLYPMLKGTKFSSQFFFDQMKVLPQEAIGKIEEEISRTALEHFKLPLDTLFFDTTNCYTYIDHDNESCELAQYGHSKEKQDNRRLFGVALLVTRTGIVPLCHHVFAGNEHDSRQFPTAVRTLCSRLEKIGLPPDSVTLVFDRGNNSKANFSLLKEQSLGFVAAMRLGDVPLDHFSIPLHRFSKLHSSGELAGIQFFRSKVSFGGETYTSVLYISEVFRHAQLASLDNQLARRLKELHEWQSTILNNTVRDNDTDTYLREKKIARILAGPYISQILSVTYDPRKKRHKRLDFSVNERAKAELIQSSFGRRLLISNRHDWSTEDILHAYFSESLVEQAFRAMKDDSSIAIRPQFHWTDHSIVVHTFTCYLALLLGRLLLLRAREIDSSFSMRSLLSTLADVRLAAVLEQLPSSKGKTNCTWQLEKMTSATQKIFSQLSPDLAL